MIITHSAYQYMYRYQGLPYFIQWVDDMVYAYFSGEPYQTLVDVIVDPEENYELLNIIVRVQEYNDSIMR